MIVKPKERFKLIPAVYLFLIKDEKILLLKRFNTGYEDGNYSVIAGHFDGKEKAIDALIREAKEEAGIKVKRQNIKFVHVMHRWSMDHERIDLFYVCNKWTGTIRNMEKNKCSGLDWFPLKKLPKNMVPCVKFAIQNCLKKIYYSEFGWEELYNRN